MNEVAIIDSGGANIASLLCAFKRLQTKAILTTDANVIQSADRVLLPGVGAARDAMNRLTNAGLVEVIRNLTQPVLGICLGMQLLCERSEEEDIECLGIIPGTVNKLPSSTSDPVPNMGWCATEVVSDHRILQDIRDRSYFYYIHSYALPVSEYTIATAIHSEPFSAVISKDNFVAAQFHPERSSVAGSVLLANFLSDKQ
ncbi:MAG: imidazole glycerol phosphate synthase subunit HisH [Woeseiaceae bacterium]|nr:imidazole glycerol phosphate synthase subunit HisH [Woeseiaceae bacterium]|tara:strand:+ start:930 stop:1529 length:600 start_codon:yes stop_codon:yes gene_type:complete